jgi:hypothetical protein
MTISSSGALATHRPKASPGIEQRISEAISKIRYGTVVVVIQDGAVVQIETTEKHRINPNSQ